MNLLKGLLGFGGSPADKLINQVKATGGFYKIDNGARVMIFQIANISFQKNNEDEYKYVVHVETVDKVQPPEYFLPIHKNMEIKTFPVNKNKQPKVCFEWFLEDDNQNQIVGIIVNPDQSSDLQEIFGHAIKQTVDKTSKADHLSFLNYLSGMPVYKKKQASTISNVSNSSKNSRMQQLNDTLVKQANDQNTKVAFTGRLNYIFGMQTKQINPSIVFVIKQKGDFQYSIYIFTDKGFKLLEKNITSDMTYEVNMDYSYIKWLDFSQGSKIVQVVFDKYDVVRDVKFILTQCMYEINTKKRMADVIKGEDQQYIKETLEDKLIPLNPKIVEVYEKVDKITFAPEHNDIISNAKKVLDKYRDKRTMVQGKKADCTIVSLANMLDVMVIDQDNNLKKVQSIELKNKKGDEVVPQKLLMHDGDTKILMQGEDQNLYYLDLNKNKIVEQFDPTPKQDGIHDIVPEKKLAQLGNFNTFIGVSHNGIYRIDPRIPKTGVAEKHIYKGDKYQFSKICTTADGNYAVGSQDGTIRLYNNKINNKTKATNKFPNVGKILHLDTTKDGKWMLATFSTHLILLPTFHDENSLYESTVQISQRLQPRKLKIKIEHLQLCKSEDKTMIPARFDQNSTNSQKFIISGFGEYVAIWPFNKVLAGYLDYTFCKAEDELNEVQFKFNDPRKVIMTTHSRISMQKTIIK